MNPYTKQLTMLVWVTGIRNIILRISLYLPNRLNDMNPYTKQLTMLVWLTRI